MKSNSKQVGLHDYSLIQFGTLQTTAPSGDTCGCYNVINLFMMHQTAIPFEVPKMYLMNIYYSEIQHIIMIISTNLLPMYLPVQQCCIISSLNYSDLRFITIEILMYLPVSRVSKASKLLHHTYQCILHYYIILTSVACTMLPLFADIARDSML